jgi:hypothetical protein
VEDVEPIGRVDEDSGERRGSSGAVGGKLVETFDFFGVEVTDDVALSEKLGIFFLEELFFFE